MAMQFRTAFHAHSIILIQVSPNLNLQRRKRNPCFGKTTVKKTSHLPSFVREEQVSSFQSYLWFEEVVLSALTNRSCQEAECSAVRCRTPPAR